MRTFYKTKLFLMVVSVVGFLIFTQCSEVIAPERPNTDLADQVILAANGNGNLTDQEKADLLYMREEEKLAHDMYNFLYEEWGMAIFAKIVPSEQKHMDAIKRLIDKHKMADIDPVVLEPDAGKFVNEKIQALYDELVAKGVLSETDALEVGVLVEEIDIEDLEHFLTRVDNQDIINVYHNILDGSYNHLDSFMALLP